MAHSISTEDDITLLCGAKEGPLQGGSYFAALFIGFTLF